MYNSTFYSFTDIKNNKDHLESSWLQLFRPDVLKPFRLILIYFFFSNVLSGVTFGPYLVEVFTIFGADVDVQWTIVSMTSVENYQYLHSKLTNCMTSYIMSIL